MKLNNFMFREEFAYTYKEVIEKLLNENAFILNKTKLVEILSDLEVITYNEQQEKITSNDVAYSFLSVGEIDEGVSANAVNVLNKVALRYKDHYAILTDTEDADVVFHQCQAFFIKVCNVLDYTFDKYDTLLGIYEAQKSHLLDKLQRIRDEDKTTSNSENHYIRKGTNVSTENESGSQVAGSKTPQTINTTGDFDEINGYWDNYDKAHESGTSSSTGSETDDGSSSRSGTEGLDATESFDPMTIMARIDEIQTQYENTMFKWVEEFDRLFVEEGNI